MQKIDPNQKQSAEIKAQEKEEGCGCGPAKTTWVFSRNQPAQRNLRREMARNAKKKRVLM